MEPINKSLRDVKSIDSGSAATASQKMPDNLDDATAMILRMRASISALGARCLSLEQELVEKSEAREPLEKPVTLSVAIYYDTGSGYNEKQKIMPLMTTHETGEISFTFSLPESAIAVRLDPGELPCIIKDISFNNKSLVAVPSNGSTVGTNCFLFTQEDPNIILTGTARFQPSKNIACSLQYLPLDNETVCTAFATLKGELERQAKQSESYILECNSLRHEIGLLRNSSSWRITSPLRAIKRLMTRILNRIRKG